MLVEHSCCWEKAIQLVGRIVLNAIFFEGNSTYTFLFWNAQVSSFGIQCREELCCILILQKEMHPNESGQRFVYLYMNSLIFLHAGNMFSQFGVVSFVKNCF